MSAVPMLAAFVATAWIQTFSTTASGLLDVNNAVCAFDVKERHIIAGPCAYQKREMYNFQNGVHFYVATHSASALQYFIIVDYYPNLRSTMFWNVTPGNQRTDLSLGDVDRTGECWHNDEAKLCVWPGLQQTLDHKPDYDNLDITDLVDTPPRFSVDSACQFTPHPQQCVRLEQGSFDVLLEHWNDIPIETRKTCGEAGAEGINDNYQIMLSCVGDETQKMELHNQGPFQYRRNW